MPLIPLSAFAWFAATQAVAPEARLASDVLSEISRFRKDYGLGALKMEKHLVAAAAWQAKDMAAHDYFDHVDSNGGRVWDRADRFGYRWGAIAENLVVGVDKPKGIVDAWAGSPGHRKNMLGVKYTEAGVAFSKDKQGRTVCVLVLATPRS